MHWVASFPEDIDELSLLVRTIVDGYLSGSHQSVFRGAGTEFSYLRAYQPGDELRRIDWRRLAATDRLMVRESELETSTVLQFLLDRSASMNITDGEYSRWNFARVLLACLAYLGDKQGDQIRALSTDTPPVSGYISTLMFLSELKADRGKMSYEILPENPKNEKEILYIISDFWDEPDDLEAFVQVQSLHQRVHLIQVMGKREESPFEKDAVYFKDPETEEFIQSSAQVKQWYKQNLKAHQARLQELSFSTNSPFTVVFFDEPIELALEKILQEAGG